MDKNPVPSKDVLANPLHPLHDEVANAVIDLRAGRINLCACMGAQYGEPYCPCEMTRRGLSPSPERVAANAEAQRRLSALFESREGTPE